MRFPAALGTAALVAAIGTANGTAQRGAAPAASDRVAIDADDIGGVVASGNGPEAGVWVFAETTDLPAKFVRTVVTDERGRYLLPDPSAGWKGRGLWSTVSTRAPSTWRPARGPRARS